VTCRRDRLKYKIKRLKSFTDAIRRWVLSAFSKRDEVSIISYISRGVVRETQFAMRETCAAHTNMAVFGWVEKGITPYRKGLRCYLKKILEMYI